MAATIKIKNSSTAGAAPTSSDLVQGELAVNVTDKRLYTENASGTVVELGTNPSVPVTFPDGSASAPSLTNDGDTNTGLFFPAADTVGITTGGTERARVDSSGNLGLGVTPSAWSAVKAMQIGTAAVYAPTSSQNTTLSANNYYDGSVFKYMTSDYASYYQQFSGQHRWYNAASGTAGNAISFTQAMTLDASGNLVLGTTASSSARLYVRGSGTTSSTASFEASNSSGATRLYVQDDGTTRFFGSSGSETARIDSSGNLLVGTTSTAASSKVTIKSDSNLALQGGTSNSTGTINFCNPSATKYWSISTNDGTWFIADADFSHYAYLLQNMTSWGFGSDRRMKKDIVDLDYGLDAVLAMKPKRYTFIASGKKDIGFIAQELKEIVPEAVSGEEVEYLETDTAQERAAKSLGIGKELLIPVLVKAIQELKAEFDAYKATHP